MIKKRSLGLLVFLICFQAFSVYALPKIRVFLPSLNPIEKAGFITAQNKNLYSEGKLEVEFVDANRNDPLTALDYGLADIVQESLPIALAKSSKNQSYTLFAQLYQMPTTVIACIKPGVEALQELKGKKLGYESEKLLVSTQIWFGYQGFQMEESTAPYQFEKYTSLAEAYGRGKLSCGIMERHQVPYITSKTASQFTFLSPTFETGGTLSEGLYVNDKALLLPGFKEILDNFLQISGQGWRYAFDHKEEFYTQILDATHKETLPIEVALRTLSLLEENFDLKSGSSLGRIQTQNVNYSILNMLQSSKYSGITDRPKNHFLSDPNMEKIVLKSVNSDISAH